MKTAEKKTYCTPVVRIVVMHRARILSGSEQNLNVSNETLTEDTNVGW